MVSYTYDDAQIEVSESKNDEDVTFNVIVKTDEMRERVKELRSYFEENKDYTDAMFYSHQDGHYEVIVRNKFYLVFLLHAFRFRCIQSLSWE
ncbi:hypothetical protein LOK74_10180 [Brevibacillus humidisoli]|uniref:hypothetical protein n=1 Tax=Brevibacillus humidisoli TaxID=2895522 RepID=UPI001E3A757A|nr:hypothetical protein [Brevibacillus humidisoli]UFJ42829.1 hypothetical protein LOK74_10180 [Brevibacillus humidisoli]